MSCEAGLNESGDTSLQQFVFVGLANEQFPEFVVAETSNTKGGQDTKTTSKGNRVEFALDGFNALGRGGFGLVEVVHGVNVNGSRQDLGDHGDHESTGQFRSVALHAVFLDKIFRHAGSHVKGGVHGGSITNGKETQGAQRCGRLFDTRGNGRVTGKNGITPGQETNVGHRGGRHLHGLSLLVILDLVRVQHEFRQVGNGVGSEIHGEGQDEWLAGQEFGGLEDHFTSGDTHVLHQLGSGTNILDDALVNDADQRTDQERGRKGTSNFLGGTHFGVFDKLVGVKVRVTEFPITCPEGLLFFVVGSHCESRLRCCLLLLY
mmetsp:Transcript_21565/g.46736  ORF Transcript_21565/g.46736 Transcript_21565/m.46736 type:complete len:319 (-) Transcript_21565:103-1059(-)